MSEVSAILIRSFVKQFYRENAGLFLFFIIVMVFSVGLLNGAGIIEYHYSLIMGMLGSTQFLLLVFLGWFFYARKCLAFVVRKQFTEQYSFFHLLNSINKKPRYLLLLKVQGLLLAPILLYGAIIISVAFWHKQFLQASFTIAYLLFLWLVSAYRQLYQLHYAQKRSVAISGLSWPVGAMNIYSIILLRSILFGQTWIFAGIKIFTCATLYGMALNNVPGDYDVNYPFLFFNFGVIANGIIVYRMRAFEETKLMFYRTMPVSLFSRWLNYALVYAVLLVPEFITIMSLAPVHLHVEDARRFGLCAYSLLLLLNSIYFLDDFSMKGYLRVVLVILCVQYFFVIADALTAQSIFFFIAAFIIFLTGYFSFEKARGQIGN